ncbi:MAG TPA: YafY family protein [Anditalea sp.]|nr:YafY family protein [Anditalea sp.]
MNRLDRLTAILTQIQSKRWVKAHEIAARFDITIRTVYRDIRALEEAGVPIISEAGKGYSLLEGYRLPPVMFTREEALSFIVAEKLIENITDKESGKHFTSALFKIKSVLKSSEKDVLDLISPQVEVISRIHPLEEKDSFLHTIISCLSAKQVICLEYVSFEKNEVTDRLVEPVGIYYSFEQWYLIGWCRLRKGYRTFRLDRIKNIKIVNETFDTSHPSLKDYLEKVKHEQNLTKVVLNVDHSVMKYFEIQKYNWGFVMEKDCGEHMELTFMTSSIDGFARWALMMGDYIKVQEPLKLTSLIKELLAQINDNLNGKL